MTRRSRKPTAIAIALRSRSLSLFLVVLAGAALFLYVWQLTVVSTTQYAVYDLTEQRTTLAHSVEGARVGIAEQQAARNLDARIADMDFVQVSEADFVTQSEIAAHVAVR
jgi:cell division protein FtsI/penicillin-binding protein 2